jgi:hypothetical protein
MPPKPTAAADDADTIWRVRDAFPVGGRDHTHAHAASLLLL